jgi:hypothetical protein
VREDPTPQGAIQCGELDVKPLHRWAEEDLTKKKKKCMQHTLDIKVNVRKVLVVYESVNWILLAQDRIKYRGLVSTLMTAKVP